MEFQETELDTEKMINAYHNLPKGHHLRQKISSLLLDANSSKESIPLVAEPKTEFFRDLTPVAEPKTEFFRDLQPVAEPAKTDFFRDLQPVAEPAKTDFFRDSYLNNLLKKFGFYDSDSKNTELNNMHKSYSTHKTTVLSSVNNGNQYTNLKSRTETNVNGQKSTKGRDFYKYENETYEKIYNPDGTVNTSGNPELVNRFPKTRNTKYYLKS